MFSFVGETVFDPFSGSGTTSLAAKNLDRNSIGYEINKEFKPIIEEKLLVNQMNIINDSQVAFEEDVPGEITFDTLPYIFTDPHRLDKKVDVKKVQFGSVIEKGDTKKQELFRVKKVISPEKIELNNGTIVNLLGIKEKSENIKEAIEFLQQKFKNRKVFLRYDEKIECNFSNPICYVYLDNKTFINNHLIKTGYVNVDMENEYTNKQKFIKTWSEKNK